MTDDESVAAELSRRVRANVAELLAEFSALAGSCDPNTTDLGTTDQISMFKERLADFVTRFGSMRRTRVAAHVLNGYQRATDPALTNLAHACSALELFHAAALVHDDIIDESDTRRHHPTLHTGWGVTLAEQRNGDLPSRRPARLGLAAGLLGGDVLLVLCARAIGRVNEPVRERTTEFFQDVQLRTVVGEFQDVLLEHRRVNADRSAITSMAVNKTAWYTVIAPMTLATLCAEADDEVLPLLDTVGSAYGEAFQLLDDLNGLLADSATTGKNPLDDMNTGKATLLHHLVRSHATADELALLRQVYGHGHCTESDLTYYRGLVRAHGDRIIGELQTLLEGARVRLREAGFSGRTIDHIEHELIPHDRLPVLSTERFPPWQRVSTRR
ncbi:polyprenyl synthetase family protein [Micromonospora sp. R77]|uniref:polyprenyl synthetase family protein n=1 Tax=Micromonospora sp. R77 TaxID=2925836 RepID=UPI001F61DB35|nr:polyprenyl synthetase family protein [Micromonospora sp. R77]MCI4061458.1 polyprenyl synthetase family protein [Micromonospora sp. R77]